MNLLVRGFPVWLCLAAATALWQPSWWAPLSRGPVTVLLLGLIMLGMGVSLTVDDFRRIGRMPKAVVIGFLAQFTIMPLLGWAVAKWLALPPAFAVGLILVGCCPGGTASNVVTYIARADVALSVVMTACSTLAAVVLTPLFTQWYAGAVVRVDGWALCVQTFQVVIVPVLAGLFLNTRAPGLVRRVLPLAPLVSVLGICVICAAAFAANAAALKTHAPELLLAVFLLHGGGFLFGALFALACGCKGATMRTISIEVGMQNSGLAVVLARQGFPGLPLATLVGAMSAVMHSLLGSVLAAVWNRIPARETDGTPPGRVGSV